MIKVIDYYFTPVSPWAYLGHERFRLMAERAGAVVQPRPVDFGRIFPASGGLPLKQRSAQRQAYRFMELKRWRAHLDLPLNLEPRHFPVDSTAACLVLVASLAHGFEATMRLGGAMLRGCWAEEKDLSDPETLVALAAGAGLDGRALLEASRTQATGATYAEFTREAIERKVFGAPTFVYAQELFWGQDRLDFLQRALAA